MESNMSEGDNAPKSMEISAPGTSGTQRRWPRTLLLGGTLAVGMAMGAAGLAGAAVVGDHMGWQHHGPRLERIQGFVRMALDSVAASSDQEAKVHDVIATAFTEIAPKPEDRAAFRKQALDLLRAPTLDKAALEKLRADFVAQQDAKSKRFLDAVEQVADILTPDQRAKLADRAESWSLHRPMMGWQGDHDGGKRDGNHGAGDDNQDQDDN
jgi:protein CpxP